jgi:transposase-like protein
MLALTMKSARVKPSSVRWSWNGRLIRNAETPKRFRAWQSATCESSFDRVERIDKTTAEDRVSFVRVRRQYKGESLRRILAVAVQKDDDVEALLDDDGIDALFGKTPQEKVSDPIAEAEPPFRPIETAQPPLVGEYERLFRQPVVRFGSIFGVLASADNANIRKLCRRFGISPTTGYNWLGRYQNDGLAGLKDQSRRPKNSPRRSSDVVEQAVVKRGLSSSSLYMLMKKIQTARRKLTRLSRLAR